MEDVSHTRNDHCVWDFVLLNPLNEEAIVKTLCHRFKQDQIYTYSGNELICVNPYKNMNIYTMEIAHDYLCEAPFLLPPHIFAVVASAYRWLNDSNEDQCIVLSGESGSGKTEILKRMLDFLSYMLPSNSEASYVRSRIIHVNIILEAFGNAETSFNKNSSRFGKFLDVEFDFKGEPVSASFTLYLLDKNRVVNQSFGERNFHIFYQLLSGADVFLLKTLRLHKNVLTYSLLKNGGSSWNAEIDKHNFRLLKKSLECLKFDYETYVNILKLISVILKLGDLTFVSVTNIDSTEGCSISNEHELYDICLLLGIDVDSFQTVLTCRSVYVNDKCEPTVVTTEMSAEEASYFRNDVCRTLYSRLFMWLVKILNGRIKTQPQYRRRRLSILDLFGFENFEKNELHQFVVNYVNEKIFQAVFERRIRSEQEEYLREGIEWSCAEIARSSPINGTNEEIYEELFAIMDLAYTDSEVDEIRFREKLAAIRAAAIDPEKCSIREDVDDKGANYFKVQHYAADVMYDISTFLRRSNNFRNKDLSIVMYGGTHPLLKDLFPEGSPERSSLKKPPSSSSKQIKISLNGILRNLNDKRLHYVRCFKPNQLKEPRIFDSNMILNQIQTQRIIESVRLRRNGFSYFLPIQQFLNRYKMLSLKTWPSSRLPAVQSIQYLLHDLPIPAAEFAFGTTKMFIRSPRSVYELEEYRRHRLNDIAVIIQCVWRRYNQRKKFLLLRRSQIMIARAWRLYGRRKMRGFVKNKRQIDWAAEIIQRHYIQWKRYQFLLRLKDILAQPRTQSPLNHDWPSCSLRLINTSIMLRKLHHKWRCHRYRCQFNQTARNKMREKVTAHFLFKDRKCCYRESVSKPFYGDYVRLKQNSHWKKMSYSGSDQYVVFADVINKITRSTGKFIPTLLVVSTSSMMIMDQRTLDIKYRIPVPNIHRISLSPFADNVAVIHIYSNEQSSISDGDNMSQCFSSSPSGGKSNTGCFFVNDCYEKGDIIFQTKHVIEVATKLYLVVQNAVGRPPDVNISTLFNAYFHQQIVTISFYLLSSNATVQAERIKVFRKGDRMDVCILEDCTLAE